ncbi:Nucleotide-diphospho-sugar transferase domain-containing protein [Plasmodiophora brassicae]
MARSQQRRMLLALAMVVVLMTTLFMLMSLWTLQARVDHVVSEGAPRRRLPRDPLLCRDHLRHPVDATKQAIHIGIIFDNESGTRFLELKTLLISLIETMSCPVHLHFVNDDATRQRVDDLLGPYVAHPDVYALEAHHHTPDAALQAVASLRTRWPSRFALLKLTPEFLFPADVADVLVVDTDTLLIADPCPAYYRLRQDSQGYAALAAPDLAPWGKSAYGPGANFERWTAPLRADHAVILDDIALYGMNSGVIFYNMGRVRQVQWTAAFMQAMPDDDEVLNLGDQNVLNIMAQAGHVGSMPVGMNFLCGFVFQLRERQRLADLGRIVDDITLIHCSCHAFAGGPLPGDILNTDVFWHYVPGDIDRYGDRTRPAYLYNFSASADTCAADRANMHGAIDRLIASA